MEFRFIFVILFYIFFMLVVKNEIQHRKYITKKRKKLC